MARGSPYRTAAWQRTRRVVLQRAGYVCEIEGPRCTRVATTCHHIKPSSQFPELFFDLGNLQAACKPCNYGGGAEVAVDNRTNRQLVDHYRQLIEQQQTTIEELTRLLEERERPRPGRIPAIR